MSVKFILLLIFVGLACYILGRLSGGRREDGGRMLQTSSMRSFASASDAHSGGTLDAASLEEVKRLLRERQLISAIKIYRERTNCGLREAKDAVEAIEKTL